MMKSWVIESSWWLQKLSMHTQRMTWPSMPTWPHHTPWTIWLEDDLATDANVAALYSVDDLARWVNGLDNNQPGLHAEDDLATNANIVESIVTLLPKQAINASNSTFLDMKGWLKGNWNVVGFRWAVLQNLVVCGGMSPTHQGSVGNILSRNSTVCQCHCWTIW